MKKMKIKKGRFIRSICILLLIAGILGFLSIRFTISILDYEHYSSYQIIGQSIVSNKDGYHNVFSFDNGPTFIEYKQDIGSWSQNKYWDGVMADEGCGITAISIIVSRLC